MSLKQLRLNKELELKRSKLNEYKEKEAELLKRSEELAVTLEEAETEEDVALVSEEIDKLEAEEKENKEAVSGLEEEIQKLEGELEDVEKRSKEPIKVQTREGVSSTVKNLQVRELLKTGEYYERSEVKAFYEQFKNLRAVQGGEITIPDVVVNRIMDFVGDYTTIYPLVDKIKVKGEARILIDTDTNGAEWLEMWNGFAEDHVGTITQLDFDGFKVGKVTFVDNYLLQDSIINIDNYVVKKLARAIGKALDHAILHGSGNKQPSGILYAIETGVPSVNAGKPATSRAIGVQDPAGFEDLVRPLALIDTGLDTAGSIVAVMNRTTYYNHVMEYSVQTASSGAVVGRLPLLSNPDILGIPVIFSNHIDDNVILYGDFSKYTLVEREGITVESSNHVRFQQDQTGFRAKGRFDGKPTNIEAFLKVTLSYTDGKLERKPDGVKRGKTAKDAGKIEGETGIKRQSGKK